MTKKEQAKILYEVDSLSAPKIAERTGLSTQFIYRLARENNWQRGPGYNHELARKQAMQEAADQKKTAPDPPSRGGVPFHRLAFRIKGRSWAATPDSKFNPFNQFSTLRGLAS